MKNDLLYMIDIPLDVELINRFKTVPELSALPKCVCVCVCVTGVQQLGVIRVARPKLG